MVNYLILGHFLRADQLEKPGLTERGRLNGHLHPTIQRWLGDIQALQWTSDHSNHANPVEWKPCCNYPAMPLPHMLHRSKNFNCEGMSGSSGLWLDIDLPPSVFFGWMIRAKMLIWMTEWNGVKPTKHRFSAACTYIPPVHMHRYARAATGWHGTIRHSLLCVKLTLNGHMLLPCTGCSQFEFAQVERVMSLCMMQTKDLVPLCKTRFKGYIR